MTGTGSLKRITTALEAGGLEDDEKLVLAALLAAGYDEEKQPRGRAGSLSANTLAAVVSPLLWDDGVKSRDRVESAKRRVRKVVNQLIIQHGIPICCEPGMGGGYYLPARDEDVELNHTRFHKRAMTGLVKATRARKAAYADAVIQLTLGFEDAARQVRLAAGAEELDDAGPPAWVKVVTGLLEQFRGDPERYAAEIRAIQDEYGDIFVRRDQVARIRALSAEMLSLVEHLK